MPILEYECPNGHRTEIINMSPKTRVPTVPCGACGETAERIISAPAPFQWGSGPKESPISSAIGRVNKAVREGKA